ncbi:hypothetical protein EVA_15483, partial [gut metagenome]
YQANYNDNSSYEVHHFLSKNEHPSMDNGLYNTMKWYHNQKNLSSSQELIDWKTAAGYYTENSRVASISPQSASPKVDGRANRRGQWALYSRNRDLNRDGKLNPNEIRWFVPAIDQYVLCFLGGRSVFENPLFEKDKAIKRNDPAHIEGVPMQHYLSSTNKDKNQVMWAEEGCSKGDYHQVNDNKICGIRMARMLCKHGVDDTGAAFGESSLGSETTLKQDYLYTVSHTPNGAPVEYDKRVDGKDYY